jgi:diaminopimelate decarboxylase
LTGNSQLLLTTVLSTKASGVRTHAIMDAGINLAESVRAEYHQVFSVNRFVEPARCTYTLVGPICSPGDTLYYAVRLPELRPGDSLAIMDAGGYFVPFATSFSFPQPGIVCLKDGETELIRRAETFEDLVAFDLG